MRKQIRKHLKQEKRIIKLLYRKGWFTRRLGLCGFDDLQDCEWSWIDWSFMPEFHIVLKDFNMEWNSRSVIESAIEKIWFDNSKEEDDYGYPLEAQMTKNKLIKYLKTLPTVVSDSKINKYLKIKR